MDYVKLKTEIALPAYAGKGDEEIAAMLNVVGREMNRETITGGQLVSCIVKSEYIALSANEKDWIKLLAATATAITITTQLRTDLGSTFPAGSGTRTALLAMVKRQGTRAEELDLGGTPTTSDVAIARQS